MDRKKYFKQLLCSNPESYTDRGMYISNKMKKRMIKKSEDVYYKLNANAFDSDVWNSKLGRSLLTKNKK